MDTQLHPLTAKLRLQLQPKFETLMVSRLRLLKDHDFLGAERQPGDKSVILVTKTIFGHFWPILLLLGKKKFLEKMGCHFLDFTIIYHHEQNKMC